MSNLLLFPVGVDPLSQRSTRFSQLSPDSRAIAEAERSAFVAHIVTRLGDQALVSVSVMLSVPLVKEPDPDAGES